MNRFAAASLAISQRGRGSTHDSMALIRQEATCDASKPNAGSIILIMVAVRVWCHEKECERCHVWERQCKKEKKSIQPLRFCPNQRFCFVLVRQEKKTNAETYRQINMSFFVSPFLQNLSSEDKKMNINNQKRKYKYFWAFTAPVPFLKTVNPISVLSAFFHSNYLGTCPKPETNCL